MRNRVIHGLFGLSLLVCGVSLRAIEPTKDSVQTIKQNLVAGKAVLIDVREIDEWNDGHLVAAAHWPLSRIERGVSAEQLAKFAPAGKIVYLHCAFGSRSVAAGKYLSKSGRDVRPLKQGYDELRQSGFRAAAN